MKLECAHADTCLPDYWCGHHRPHVQIPVTPGMSLKAIKEEIRNALWQGAVSGSCDDENAETVYAFFVFVEME